MKRGYVHVYTGSGKGKTTAALGLALRAVGHGFQVCVVQFMKSKRQVGEVRAAARLAPHLSIHPMGPKGFIRKTPRPIDHDMARKALEFSRNVIQQGDYDVIILDEVNVAVQYGLITIHDVLALTDLKPEAIELVLTGRDAHPKVIERADLVTEMLAIKHYFDRGVPARKGIEF